MFGWQRQAFSGAGDFTLHAGDSLPCPRGFRLAQGSSAAAIGCKILQLIDSAAGSPYAAHLDDRAGRPALSLYGQLLPGPPDGSGFAKIGLKL